MIYAVSANQLCREVFEIRERPAGRWLRRGEWKINSGIYWINSPCSIPAAVKARTQPSPAIATAALGTYFRRVIVERRLGDARQRLGRPSGTDVALLLKNWQRLAKR